MIWKNLLPSRIIELFRETEVSQFQIPAPIDQKIFGFQISKDKAQSVEMFQYQHNLRREESGNGISIKKHG